MQNQKAKILLLFQQVTKNSCNVVYLFCTVLLIKVIADIFNIIFLICEIIGNIRTQALTDSYIICGLIFFLIIKFKCLERFFKITDLPLIAQTDVKLLDSKAGATSQKIYFFNITKV